MLQHVRWLQQAGAHLPSDVTKHIETNGKTCEISPLVSYAGENLEYLKGQTLDVPIFLEINTDKQESNNNFPKKISLTNDGITLISSKTNGVQH